jgi:general secretion pathway protein G
VDIGLLNEAVLHFHIKERRKMSELGKKKAHAVTSAQGFTLIELMVVMVILGILAGLIVPRIMDRPEEARRTKAGIQIQSIEQALKLYKLDNGQYPTTEQGLLALVEAPAVGVPARKWRTGGYLEKGKVPKDPWDGDFVYLSPGLHGDFDLISYGPDHQSGGEGNDADINNWELQ